MDATDELLDAIGRLEREVRDRFDRVEKHLDRTDGDYQLLRNEFQRLDKRLEVVEGEQLRAKERDAKLRQSIDEERVEGKNAMAGLVRHFEGRFEKLEEDGRTRGVALAAIVTALTPGTTDAPPTKLDAMTKGQSRSLGATIIACALVAAQIALELLRQHH